MKSVSGYLLCFLATVFFAASALFAGETITYSYDALGRLVAVSTSGTAPSAGQNVSTTFDPAGNRTNYTVTGVGGGGGTPTLSIANTTNGAEPGTNGVLTVTQSATSATNTVVSLTYSGTATNISDYTRPSSVTIFAGQTSATVTLTVVDDSAVEGSETVVVTLSSVISGTATIGSPSSATNSIADNDSGGGGSCTVIVPINYTTSSNYQSQFSGLSGTGAGMRDGAYVANNSVHGTNNGGNEYIRMDLGSSQTVASVVMVPNGASGWGATYLNSAVLQRSTDGTNWTAVATVSGAANGVEKSINVGASARYLRLLKATSWLGVGDFKACSSGGGGGTPTVSIGNASVTEGGNLVFPVTLSAAASGAVTASYASASGTATSGADFTAASGSVSVPAGSTSGSITVSTIDDTTVESAETMTVTLSAPSGATLGTAIGTGTINDNDSGGGTANLSIGNASVTEGGTLAFTVTRSGTTTSAVSASYSTSSGTATSGSDFNAASGTVSFAANQTSATINVTTVDDSSVESAETMTVTLSGPSSGAAITGATGTGTINDNDAAAPTLSIANTTNGSEPGTNGVLTVTQSAASGTNTVVSLSYSGSASNGSDYSAPSSVTIPAGSTSATVTLSVIDDSAVEGSETATVTLGSVTSGTATIGSPASATNTIADNDSAPTQIQITVNSPYFSVVPSQTAYYNCGEISLPEFGYYAQYCALNSNNVVVYDTDASPQFDPGYSLDGLSQLQVLSTYHNTGVAP